MRVRARRSTITIALACSLCAVVGAEAQAAFPGENGKIAFVDDRDGNPEVYTANADGSDVTRLTFSSGTEYRPHWSPDGERIAFLRRGPVGGTDIYLIDADGSDETRTGLCETVPDCGLGEPAWSPDGTQLAWGFDDHCGWGGLWVANADGTDPRYVHCGGDRGFDDAAWSPDGEWIAYIVNIDDRDIVVVHPDGTDARVLVRGGFPQNYEPDWHPDGGRLAFHSWVDDFPDPHEDIYTVHADGTDLAVLRSNARSPAWSPDGTRILFESLTAPVGISTMNADGTDARFLTAGRQPHWQPIPINSYPRPRGASPLRMSLAIAYDKCLAPNRTHAAPLAFASCSPPTKTSQHLTVGTGDSNGLPARNDGYVRLRAVNGDPSTPADEADVTVELFSDDVFTTALDDYTGELRAELPITITDKDNTPHPGGPGAATTVDFPLHVDAPCAALADPREGSTCQVTTTVDALIPGAIKEGRRSNWEVGQVIVYDGGPDGDTATAGNTVFARQGVFIP